ncbi:hypothetical protein PMAYCL1PPCAC_21965, partial [Pristionchus mayeri]
LVSPATNTIITARGTQEHKIQNTMPSRVAVHCVMSANAGPFSCNPSTFFLRPLQSSKITITRDSVPKSDQECTQTMELRYC